MDLKENVFTVMSKKRETNSLSDIDHQMMIGQADVGAEHLSTAGDSHDLGESWKREAKPLIASTSKRPEERCPTV